MRKVASPAAGAKRERGVTAVKEKWFSIVFIAARREQGAQNADGPRWIILTNYIRNFGIVMCHVIQMGTYLQRAGAFIYR
jgi:hypothetical protein